MGFAWTIVVLVVLLAISWRFLGSYMPAVFEGRVRWLSLAERPITEETARLAKTLVARPSRTTCGRASPG